MTANRSEELTARYTRRKIERIVQKTCRAHWEAIKEYGTLSADEILAIGVNLMMTLTVAPLEKLAVEPAEMRRQVVQQMMLMVEKGSDNDQLA